MNQYRIEQKILTLSDCAVIKNKEKKTSFNVEDISFTHWDFNYYDIGLSDVLIAEAIIEAE